MEFWQKKKYISVTTCQYVIAPILRACECTGERAVVSDVKSRSECEMAEPVCSLLMKL